MLIRLPSFAKMELSLPKPRNLNPLSTRWEYCKRGYTGGVEQLERLWKADNDRHVLDSIHAAGIDANSKTDDGGRTGVPNFVFRDDPVFGQDRMSMPIGRLKQ